MKITDMDVGQEAVISGFESSNSEYRKKLLSMGLTKGTKIKLTKRAPLGDPLEIEAINYKLSLRKDEADIIIMEDVK